MRLKNHSPIVVAIAASMAVAFSIATLAGCRAGNSAASTTPVIGQPLAADQEKAVEDAAKLMASRGLADDAVLTNQLLAKGIWKAARPDDPYMKASEKSGDTPYAYTLSDGKHPSAIVLASRFFTEATPTGRAAVMVHELGHYRAYVATGKSDETDGYKAEYDKHAKLGLTQDDGLVYFSMLDGVQEYVVPKYPAYKNYPDVKQYMTQSP